MKMPGETAGLAEQNAADQVHGVSAPSLAPIPVEVRRIRISIVSVRNSAPVHAVGPIVM